MGAEVHFGGEKGKPREMSSPCGPAAEGHLSSRKATASFKLCFSSLFLGMCCHSASNKAIVTLLSMWSLYFYFFTETLLTFFVNNTYM